MPQVNAQSSASDIYIEIKSLLDQSRESEALAVADQAMMFAQGHTIGICALAAVAYRTNMLGNAIQLLLELQDTPEAPTDTQELLAVLYCLAGILPKALYHGKESAITPPDGKIIALFGSHFPTFADALASISHKPLMRAGMAALDTMDLDQAIQHLEQHLMVEPNCVEAIDHYARALARKGQSAKALGMLRSLVTLGGAKPTLLSRIGACLVALGRHDEGLAAHRAAVTQAPNAMPLWSELLASLAYVPSGRSDAVADTARWMQAIERNCVKSPRPAPQMGSLDRVTIAFLCSAPHDPTTADMLAQLIRGLDKSRFAVLGLGNGELAAPHNVMFRGVIDRWRNVSELDVLTLGALIRGEGVGLLIDMDGLSVGTRNGLFLRKCAPYQVAWLNAPVHGAVPGANIHLVAGPSDLPGALVLTGGRVLIGGGFDAGPLPCRQTQTVTFGVEASLAEISADSAALWAMVLAAVPGSMLAIRGRGQFGEQQSVDHIIELFGNFGVAHRIDVIETGLAEFAAQVDMVLAPTPHVDVQSLGRLARSGVPVIVLAGGCGTDDLAAAFHDVGWGDDMVAEDASAYVGLARIWAESADKLEVFRAQAALQAADGVAFSPARFTADFTQSLMGHLADATAAVG